MNLGQTADEINTMLKLLDDEFALAKRETAKIKPNLLLARCRVNGAFNTIQVLANVITAGQAQGIMQPLDVIRRLNATNDELVALAHSVLSCEDVIQAHDTHKASPLATN